MKKFIAIGIVLLAFAVAVHKADSEVNKLQDGDANNVRLSAEVQQLCDDFWDWRMMDMPEFATFVGIHDYDDLLDDLSFTAYARRLAKCEELLVRIEDLEPTLVEHTDVLNVNVLRDELQVFIDGYPFKNFVQPLNYMEGPQTDLLRLLSWMPLDTFAQYNTLITRLGQVKKQLEDIELLLQDGAGSGLYPHTISTNGVAEALGQFVVGSAEESPLYTSFFTTFPANITEEEALNLQARAMTIIDEVTPAFERLMNYVATEYPRREQIAVTSLPNGAQLYDQLIKFHTGDNSTPEEIHSKGLEEVDRIDALMLGIVIELGYSNLTTQEFSQLIKEDPSNFYDTASELMDAFQDIVYNIAIPALPLAFKDIPEAEIILVEDPSPDSPVAFYLAGSYDGSRPGIFYVNTYDPHAQPKYEMLTLSLHEGNPGHHLQGSHALESSEMPFFRRVMDDRNYARAPSRFPMRTYYVEGWGLYSESVGFDMDLFGDALERYGHYSDEMFRACRLVIDTGIHALNWTKEMAVDYMLQHTAMTLVAVENEVNRYITWPGQALAYKWGQLQLSSFRASAEDRLGALFDLKDFHDIILDSVGPMSVVGQEVDEWVNSVLNP